MRGFSFQWNMRDIIPHCDHVCFLNMRNKILHIHAKRVFSHKMINICKSKRYDFKTESEESKRSLLTCQLPRFQSLSVPRHTPQYLPGHWLHTGVHLLIFAVAGVGHSLLKEAIDLLKVNPLQIQDQFSLLLRAEFIPELQEVRLGSFSQFCGQSICTRVHDQRWFFVVVVEPDCNKITF